MFQVILPLSDSWLVTKDFGNENIEASVDDQGKPFVISFEVKSVLDWHGLWQRHLFFILLVYKPFSKYFSFDLYILRCKWYCKHPPLFR